MKCAFDQLKDGFDGFAEAIEAAQEALRKLAAGIKDLARVFVDAYLCRRPRPTWPASRPNRRQLLGRGVRVRMTCTRRPVQLPSTYG